MLEPGGAAVTRRVGSHFKATEGYQVNTLQRPTNAGVCRSSAFEMNVIAVNDIDNLNYT
jgi:hypothetical protein